jgi:DNA polymerase III sliding clamp (beta) subunit (PCNA family)
MNEIQLPLDALKAVAYAMPEKDKRAHLNGVRVEVNDEGGWRLIASDGARTHIYDNNLGAAHKVAHAATIPAAVVKDMLKFRNSHITLAVGVNESVTTTPRGQHTFKNVEGNYPQYRNILPGELKPTAPANYNTEHLNDAQKALKAVGWPFPSVELKQQGDNVAVAFFNSLTVLIMPYRARPAGEQPDYQSHINQLKR